MRANPFSECNTEKPTRTGPIFQLSKSCIATPIAIVVFQSIPRNILSDGLGTRFKNDGLDNDLLQLTEGSRNRSLQMKALRLKNPLLGRLEPLHNDGHQHPILTNVILQRLYHIP